MDESDERPTIKITEVRESDIQSLATIVPRAFHPVNPYIKNVLPDTPRIRAWWAHIFEDERNDPACHNLVAIDTSTDKDVGILTLRLLKPGERGAGVWTKYELTEDHDKDTYKAMVDSMVVHRERLMLERPHFLIGLFGVQHGLKGSGVGSMLLKRACEVADENGVEVFVQANASAKGFYERLGFEVRGEEVMPGEEKYKEFMLVRPSKKR